MHYPIPSDYSTDLLARAKRTKLLMMDVDGVMTDGGLIQRICKSVGVSAAECIFVGDDIIDLPAFALSGLSIAVADAHPLVLANVDWVTKKAGGCGAVREVCELIMHAQDTLKAAMEPYMP